ncbi:MAG: adenylate/guanylate cyclase domain-containing protein [Candidatus Latescibacterota bacterium]
MAAFSLNGLLAGAVAWLAGQTAPLQGLEGRALDWRFQMRRHSAPRSDRIVLVLIEEEVNLPYRSPVPRDHLARVVEQVSGADLIGLDILFDGPSFDAAGDERLCAALRRAGNAVAVSYLADGEEHLPDPLFAACLRGHGYATFATATDVEVVRRGTVWRDLPPGRALSLAGCLYALSLGLDPARVRAGEAPLPAGEVLINYSGPPSSAYRTTADLGGGFTVCPSHLVAAGVYPREFFRGKIVLVGSGLLDAPDQFRTPLFAGAYGYRKSFGVEIHAHLLQTLLSGRLLREWGPGLELAAVAVLALVAALLVSGAQAVISGLAAVLLLAGWWAAGFAVFARAGLVLPLVVPSLGLVLGLGAALGYQALSEGRDKRQVRRLFERYLAPDVVRELLADPASWELGGKTMDITVMFADLEGFTPIAEKLAPHEMVRLINTFLTEMSAILLEEGGTIDKYEGDLIMAFFGAPLAQADHASRGCRAALRMQARMSELRQGWAAQGLPELRLRIGLHSGAAVVGNMGSDFHSNYTAMGDTVNLASRLEQENKRHGTYTMVSRQTQVLAGGEGFAYRALGPVTVKGKSEPTEVYELLPGGSGTAGSALA